jgi:hypothetical protein
MKDRTTKKKNTQKKQRTNGEGKEAKVQQKKWNTYCVACNRLQDTSVPTSSKRNFINFHFRSPEYSYSSQTHAPQSTTRTGRPVHQPANTEPATTLFQPIHNSLNGGANTATRSAARTMPTTTAAMAHISRTQASGNASPAACMLRIGHVA